MSVTQIIKWKTEDGKEFDNEDDALTHEAYAMRREELAMVLDQAWYRGIDKDDVVSVLLDNFIFTLKED